MKKVLIAAIGIFLFLSCHKTQQTVTMSYKMTQCSDPWVNEAYYQNKENAIRSFLEMKGVNVIHLKITTNIDSNEVNCQACTCLSNDTVTVEIHGEDIVELKALHFIEITNP